jgi:glycosyl transferase, family 25
MPPQLGIWLINLDRSKERLDAMIPRLAALGLDYTRFAAIDGQAEWTRLVSSVDITAFRSNVGREVLPGEIGCYLSHLAVWQALIDSPHDVALILEDDVVFHADFMSAVERAISIQDRWDMVKLNFIRAKQPVKKHAIGRYVLNAYVGAFTGMGAYLITKRFAASQLPLMLPAKCPIDHMLDRFHSSDFRHFGMEPFPSHVYDGNVSTITGAQFSSVRKFPWHARLQVYRQRFFRLLLKSSAILLSAKH